MGGLIILLSLGVTTLLWSDLKNPYVWAVLLVTMCFGAIGFIDDFAKVTKQHHGGLSARMRLFFEFVTARSRQSPCWWRNGSRKRRAACMTFPTS